VSLICVCQQIRPSLSCNLAYVVFTVNLWWKTISWRFIHLKWLVEHRKVELMYSKCSTLDKKHVLHRVHSFTNRWPSALTLIVYLRLVQFSERKTRTRIVIYVNSLALIWRWRSRSTTSRCWTCWPICSSLSSKVLNNVIRRRLMLLKSNIRSRTLNARSQLSNFILKTVSRCLTKKALCRHHLKIFRLKRRRH